MRKHRISRGDREHCRLKTRSDWRMWVQFRENGTYFRTSDLMNSTLARIPDPLHQVQRVFFAVGLALFLAVGAGSPGPAEQPDRETGNPHRPFVHDGTEKLPRSFCPRFLNPPD